MKLTRESLRAKKALHKNTVALHDGQLRRVRMSKDGDGSVTYTFDHKINDSYGSLYRLTLTQEDLRRLVQP